MEYLQLLPHANHVMFFLLESVLFKHRGVQKIFRVRPSDSDGFSLFTPGFSSLQLSRTGPSTKVSTISFLPLEVSMGSLFTGLVINLSYLKKWSYSHIRQSQRTPVAAIHQQRIRWSCTRIVVYIQIQGIHWPRNSGIACCPRFVFALEIGF